jgi:hypothetical protein
MLTTFRRRFATRLLDWQCRGILETPPLLLRPAPIRVVSMVRTEHVRMYLLAIKSFCRWLPGGGVVVLDDGSLTAEDRALLARHIPGLTITPIAGIITDPCPRGGCWERLLHILDLSAESYVVQLDSDVLTIGPVPEVMAAIEANRCFTLGSDAGFGVVGLEEAAAAVAGGDLSTLQLAAETALPGLPTGLGRRYVRGSAGFAGFARGAVTRGAAQAFSAAMQALMGERWREWGTEQVASNYLVANAAGGEVLPWPAYACFYPSVSGEESKLLHFIGTWRFERGVYAAKGRQVIHALSAHGATA